MLGVHVGPRAFLERCIATIETLDPQVGAFVATNLPAARAAADAATARWKSRTTPSLIDGMPVGIKDIIETIDMPTGQGSPLWEGTATRRDSAAVHALREAGAVVLGKVSTTEFAAGTPFAQTCNPHDPTRTPGDIRNVETVYRQGIGYDSAKLIAFTKGMVGIK